MTVEVDNRAPSVGITASFLVSQIASIHITPAASPVTGARLILAPLFGLPVRTFDFDPSTGSGLPTTFQWDGLLADGSAAPIGLYTVTLEAWDAYGHTGRASGLVIIPAPAVAFTRNLTTPLVFFGKNTLISPNLSRLIRPVPEPFE